MAENIYDRCDKAIREMNRIILRDFGKIRLAKWDEIHIIREVTAVYQEELKRAKQRFYEIAFEAYLIIMAECGIVPMKAQRMAEKAITSEWVDEVIEQTDPVTLYRFDTETERKAQRLIEALSATEQRSAEIDKAIREWSKQIGQYAINFTDYAALQAFMDAGVMELQWVTAKDERVCHKCHALDGRIFPVDEVPRKPHWGCRCFWIPVVG